MAKVRKYSKNVACLESLWDRDLENRLSILPVLDIISKVTRNRCMYLTCNTKAELRHNLDLFGNKKSYSVLMMAFHGVAGEIELAHDTFVPLEDLATMMRKRFAGWVVHFASCGTVKASDERLAAFVEKTGVAMVMGYTRKVDWTESVVMDMLVLRWLQYYIDLKAMVRHLQKNYPDLIAITGFQAYPTAE
jgi:hypothetical protein